jgi:hypothetical protein
VIVLLFEEEGEMLEVGELESFVFCYFGENCCNGDLEVLFRFLVRVISAYIC